MDLLKTIELAWAWRGIVPTELVGINSFGNVIVKTASGDFWRICPEELSAELVATSVAELEKLQSDPQFKDDWKLPALLHTAQTKLGTLDTGRCYCLKIPAVLGGKYAEDNLATISIAELIAASGDMAHQIADLPDGTRISVVVGRRPQPRLPN